MEEPKSLVNLLADIKKLSSVTDVLLMTRTGMFVLGSMRKSTSLDKFVGMAAILMGSAEAMSLELEDPMNGVVVQTKNYQIAITSYTEDVLVAVTFHGKKNERKVLEELNRIITEE